MQARNRRQVYGCQTPDAASPLAKPLTRHIFEANVYLHGAIEGRRFHGTWSFKGYAGAITEGTFEAIRK